MSTRFIIQTGIAYILMFALTPFLLIQLNQYLGLIVFSSFTLVTLGSLLLLMGILITAESFRELFF